MFKIRQEQLDSFALAMEERYIDRVLHHLESRYPEVVYTEEPWRLRAVVRQTIAEAKGHGLVSEHTIGRYIAIRFDLGPDYQVDPDWAWVGEVWRDPSLTEDQKVLEVDTLLYGAPIIPLAVE
jgi:hypothetical protein